MLPQHIKKLECLERLLADSNNRFLVVENQQPCERDIIAHQLFGCIDSIAADPMTNDAFLNSLEWWNEQQASKSEMKKIESAINQDKASSAIVKKELRRVKEEESVLYTQEHTLEALKCKVMQKFDEKELYRCLYSCDIKSR